MGVERVSEVAMVTERREGGKEGGARKRREGRMEGKCPLIKCCTVFFQFCGMHSPRAVNSDSIQLLRGEQLRRPVGGGERGHVQPSLTRFGRHVFTSHSTCTTAYAGTNSRKRQQFNMSLQNSSKEPFSKTFCH